MALMAGGLVLEAFDTGWTHVGTGANDATIGTRAWALTSNITATDAITSSTGTMAIGEVMNYLKGTNLGFSIPAGAIIDGIEVRAYAQYQSYVATIEDVNIVKSDGSIGTTNKAGSEALTASLAYYTFGGASDLWDESWTAADINDIDFGFVLSLTNGANVSRSFVDSFEIKVYYRV